MPSVVANVEAPHASTAHARERQRTTPECAGSPAAKVTQLYRMQAHTDGHGAGRTRLERHVYGRMDPAHATATRDEPDSTPEPEPRRTRTAANTRRQTPWKMTS